jgi:hypothetical protein
MKSVAAGIFLAVLLVLSVSGPALCADPAIRQGMWEVTTEMDMSGMPGMPEGMAGFGMKPMTTTQCMGGDDPVPDQGSDQENDCEVLEQSVKGGTVTWKVKCRTDQGDMMSTGEITYTGDTFKGYNKTDMGGSKITQKMSGRRIGDCKN